MITFTTHRAGGALIVRALGLLTAASTRKLRAQLRAELEQASVVKALIDLRAAAVLMTEDDLNSIFCDDEEPPVEVAAGLLVDPAHERMAWRYCMRATRTGRTRLPFVSLPAAEAWLGVRSSPLKPSREFVPKSEAAR